jgi:hypothetical protein
MAQGEPRKNNSTTIAIIGLFGTIITALFGSPVLVEWIKSRQATATPPAFITPTPGFTEQVLIFREDFDNDTVSGFSYEGNWRIGKDKNNRVLLVSEPGKATFGPSDFTNGIVEFRAQIRESTGAGIAAVNFRESKGGAYALAFSEGQLVLGRQERNGSFQAFSGETARSLVLEKGAWYLIRVEVRGSEMIVFVDNNRIMSASDESLSKGGLSFSVDGGMQVSFDDVNVWELK